MAKGDDALDFKPVVKLFSILRLAGPFTRPCARPAPARQTRDSDSPPVSLAKLLRFRCRIPAASSCATLLLCCPGHGASPCQNFLSISHGDPRIRPSTRLHHRGQIHVQRQKILSGTDTHRMTGQVFPFFLLQSDPLADFSKHRRYNLRRQWSILRLAGLFGRHALARRRRARGATPTRLPDCRPLRPPCRIPPHSDKHWPLLESRFFQPHRHQPHGQRRQIRGRPRPRGVRLGPSYKNAPRSIPRFSTTPTHVFDTSCRKPNKRVPGL